MSGDVVLEARNLGKKFCRSLRRSLWYGACDLAREVGMGSRNGQLRKDEFWALEDISIAVERSECLGVIGPNGAGKTTLLRILLGLVKPDRGSVRLRGRVGSLIDLHAGLHPLLTGRENIYAAGSLLGLTREEIHRQFDAIVDFSELEAALDTPVKFYSSGMAVRLGFSIAAEIRPDILIIDEVLAVGDAGFRAKCYNRIRDMQQHSAIVFVSHIMPSVSRVCDRVIVLDHGRACHSGDVASGIHVYQGLFPMRSTFDSRGTVTHVEVALSDESGEPADEFSHGDTVRVVVDLEVTRAIEDPVISVHFLDVSGDYVMQSSSAAVSHDFGKFEAGSARVTAAIPNLQLSHGSYNCSVVVFDRTETEFHYWAHGVAPFRVTRAYPAGVAYQPDAVWSLESRE